MFKAGMDVRLQLRIEAAGKEAPPDEMLKNVGGDFGTLGTSEEE